VSVQLHKRASLWALKIEKIDYWCFHAMYATFVNLVRLETFAAGSCRQVLRNFKTFEKSVVSSLKYFQGFES